MKDAWVLEVNSASSGASFINRVAFNTKGRMDAAYRKIAKAMKAYEDRINMNGSMIEIAGDDGGKLMLRPRDVVTFRSVNVTQYMDMLGVEEK